LGSSVSAVRPSTRRRNPPSSVVCCVLRTRDRSSEVSPSQRTSQSHGSERGVSDLQCLLSSSRVERNSISRSMPN
jgi:hypothetical protein